MSITHTVTWTYRDQSSNPITKTAIVIGGTEKNIDASVPVAADQAYPITLDRTKLLSLCLYSDVALTIETNSSSAPTDTIVLTAGQNRQWELATDGLAACPITASVTSMFLTNAAAGVAAFKLRALLSAT